MTLKDPKITFLINRDYATIELHDGESSLTLFKVTLTPDELSAILSRQGYVKCKAEIHDRIALANKRLETSRLEFEIPFNTTHEDAYKYALQACPEGWEADNYFRSQGSFFNKDGKNYAMTIIRRWV